MAETTTKVASNLQAEPARSVTGVIIASASEAFFSALMVWLLGGVAFSIAGSFAGDMVPSPPPLFHGQPSGKPHHAKHGEEWSSGASGFVLGVFFAIFFAHSLWVGFHGRGIAREGRLERIVGKLREDWFSLIVTNALTACIAVEFLKFGQEISLWNLVWQWIWELVSPFIGGTGRFVLGPDKSSALGQWFSWYGDNQMKLNFWIIYLAGAFDDLGVPNYKTLARWAWRRYHKRKATAPRLEIKSN